ncbi:MAG: hypothetical protein NXI20_14725 [bacterium]|nr:hypothetical protein [bacterium]
MYAQLEKSKENNRAAANSVTQTKSRGNQDFGFVDNRPEAIAQRKLQQSANQKNSNFPMQRIHKTMEPPSKMELEMMGIWNEASLHLIKLLKYEKKGLHGTNYKHAISMMTQGIKVDIPDDKRTSDVTPKGHKGFYVDTSEEGGAHAYSFAEMAAYGTPNSPSDVDYEQNLAKAMEKEEQAQAEFKKHKELFADSKRGVVLEIWGPSDVVPKEHDKHKNEAIFLLGADQMLVTIKEFV